jgi:alkylhydroperoxidase family enzyme
VKEGIQDAKHAAVLRYTDAMTLDVQVPEDVFAELRTRMSEREIVELTASVAAYNCVSRFLVALDVGETNGQAGPEKEWEL